MSKKLTVGKILGIIFCVLAAAGTVVLLFVNAYFSGQMKVIDKYYTALERNDFEGYKACFSYAVTEEEFAKDREKILILQDNEKIHAKAEFDKRMQHDAPDEDYYAVYYDLTVYNDSENVKTGEVLSLLRSNGGWLIIR